MDSALRLASSHERGIKVCSILSLSESILPAELELRKSGSMILRAGCGDRGDAIRCDLCATPGHLGTMLSKRNLPLRSLCEEDEEVRVLDDERHNC